MQQNLSRSQFTTRSSRRSGRRSVRRLVTSLITLTLLGSLVGAVPAQAATPATSAPRPASFAYTPPPAPANFRAQLQAYYEHLKQVGKQHPDLDAQYKFVRSASMGEQALPAITDQQLAVVYLVYSSNPDWQRTPDVIVQLNNTLQREDRTRATRPINALAIGTGCTDNPGGITARYAAQAAVLIADAALAATPSSVVAGLIVAGEGAVATLPISPYRIAAAVAQGTAQATLAGLNKLHEMYRECFQNASYDTIDTINTNVNTINSNVTSLTKTVKDDFATLETNLSSDTTTILAAMAQLSKDLAADFQVVNKKLDGLQHGIVVVQNSVNSVQTTLDTNIEQRQIHIQVIPIPRTYRYLLSVTESGRPIRASLVSLIQITAQAKVPATATDITKTAAATQVAPGVLDIQLLTVPAPNFYFQFEVKDDGSSGVVHYGTVLWTPTAGSIGTN